MQLDPSQLADIQAHLAKAKLAPSDLSEELLDHISCQIEEQMVQGEPYERARTMVCAIYTTDHLQDIQKQVSRATRKSSLMQKIAFLTLILLVGVASWAWLQPATPSQSASDTQPTLTATVSLAPPSASPLPDHYEVTSDYGWRIHPINKEKVMHTGSDLRAPLGTPVYATGDGTIVYSKCVGKWGCKIVIQHDATYTSMYGHMQQLLVEEGTFVYRGEQIGTVGSTGVSTGPHLHYEIHKEGKAVDPEPYMPEP